MTPPWPSLASCLALATTTGDALAHIERLIAAGVGEPEMLPELRADLLAARAYLAAFVSLDAVCSVLLTRSTHSHHDTEN